MTATVAPARWQSIDAAGIAHLFEAARPGTASACRLATYADERYATRERARCSACLEWAAHPLARREAAHK